MKVTARNTLSTLRGQRDILMGQLVEAKRAGAPTAKIEVALSRFEYAEATVHASLAAGKSGLKAGVAAGFVPYAER
jgi:hypothetical protein